MSPRTSGEPEQHRTDEPGQPCVAPDPEPSGWWRAINALESRYRDLRYYAYRGRHRSPRRFSYAIQATAALVALGGLGTVLALTPTTSETTAATGLAVKSASATELAARNRDFMALRAVPDPQPTPAASSAAPAGKPAATTEKPATEAAKATTPAKSTTPQDTTAKASTPDSSPSKETTPAQATLAAKATQPSWLPVTQAAAQPTDTIGTWLNQALGILKAHGYSESEMNAVDIRAIIQHESGGNPDAINLWDSNAAKGTPSKGLMQTIDPTFDTYALPGYGDIYNPVDNIIAGVRYAIATYGSISNVPGIVSMADGGSYQGY